MIKKLKNIIWLLPLLPSLVRADGDPNTIIGKTPTFGLPSLAPGARSGTISGTVAGLIMVFLGIVGLISVAYIIYGGFRYVTSGGNSEVTAAAKKTIINALIGLIIVVLSYVIVRIVTNLAFNQV